MDELVIEMAILALRQYVKNPMKAAHLQADLTILRDLLNTLYPQDGK